MYTYKYIFNSILKQYDDCILHRSNVIVRGTKEDNARYLNKFLVLY